MLYYYQEAHTDGMVSCKNILATDGFS